MRNAFVISLSDELTDCMAEAVRRVKQSLVTIQNGRRGFGAGVIWRSDGLILTNNHVVARGRLRVGLEDGRNFEAQVIANDPEVDLALLQIEANDLPAALVADTRTLRVGQIVLAIGHPWGQRGAVTAGLISGLGEAETRGKRGSVAVIRSDVELAPGNSGGPLVNAAGAVVGINTMIIGGDLSLAVPSHVANEFVNQVIKTGRVTEPKPAQHQQTHSNAERVI